MSGAGLGGKAAAELPHSKSAGALLDGPVPKDNVTDWGSTRPPMARYPENRVAY
jgi:hypothetical protein